MNPQTAPQARPVGRPRQQDDEQVLQKLLELFWQRGFEATSLLDMEAATGLNKASLRYRFGSKHEIFELVMERYNGRYAEALFAVVEQGKSGLADVRAFLEALEQATVGSLSSDNIGCFATNSAVELSRRDPFALSFHTQYRKRFKGAFKAALERAVQLGEITPPHAAYLADVLVLAFFGIVTTVRSGGDKKELRERFAALRAMLEAASR